MLLIASLGFFFLCFVLFFIQRRVLLIATLGALLHYRASFNHLIASARQWDPYARETGTKYYLKKSLFLLASLGPFKKQKDPEQLKIRQF